MSYTLTRAGPYGIRARADAFAPRWMDVPEVAVSTSFQLVASARLEIERAPGDERGLVRQAGEVQVRFGVKFGHVGSISKIRVLWPIGGTQKLRGGLPRDAIPAEIHGRWICLVPSAWTKPKKTCS